jgi:hypothetical protein
VLEKVKALNRQLLALSSLPSLVAVDVPTVASDESGEMHISENSENINLGCL